jgi:hypothetical protein
MIQLKKGAKILIISSMMLGISACQFVIINNQTDSKVELKAMTWTTLQLKKSWDNEHSYALVGSDANTNPYQGDTILSKSLPILCIKKQDLPKPSFIEPHSTPGGASRGSWSGGYIGLTKPIQGVKITSLEKANQMCQQAFGEGYRMAQFHDGEGSRAGWDFWGEVVNLKFNLQDRFWVHISDQPANPWSYRN